MNANGAAPLAGDAPAAAAPADAAGATYRLTAFLFLRALGFIYTVAFLALVVQMEPLIGERGLHPARLFLDELAARAGGGSGAGSRFGELPTLFWIDASDSLMLGAGIAGLVVSVLVLAGLTNAVAMAALWAVYLSFVNVGQVFYGYGWEILLLEAGFLAIFLCPLSGVGPFPRSRPPAAVIWLVRWPLQARRRRSGRDHHVGEGRLRPGGRARRAEDRIPPGEPPGRSGVAPARIPLIARPPCIGTTGGSRPLED
jgi:hypothetical protein